MRFVDNVAAASGNDVGGGAIHAVTGHVNVRNSVFTGNRGGNGGAIGHIQARLTLEDTVFSGNATHARVADGGSGGAVYTDGSNSGPVVIRRSSFLGNTRHQPRGSALHLPVRRHLELHDRGLLVLGQRDGEQRGCHLPPERGPHDPRQHVLGEYDRRPGRRPVAPRQQPGRDHELHLRGQRRGGPGPEQRFERPRRGDSHQREQRRDDQPLDDRLQPRRLGGGGITGGGGSSRTTLRATIVARNTADNGGNPWNIAHNCSTQLLDGGFNLQYPNRAHPSDPNDPNCTAAITIADPRLPSLAWNGGLAPTLAPPVGSPALDAVTSGCPPPAIDQRGVARPLGARCDIGAVEVGAPFGVVDTPADGAGGVTGAIPVTGWALDDTTVQAVEVWRDAVSGEPAGPLFVGTATFVAGARPDVAAAYPTYPNADRAGWGYMLLTNMLPAGGNGTYRLHLWAIDGEGTRTLLGSRTLTCTNATATKPFGTIDTPGQGQTVSGSGYVVFGWALTPQAGTIPTDGSTIWVYVDGTPRGHPVYNQYRSDIATLFPGYANTNGAVGYYVLDTTSLANGIHTIAWSVTDNQGRADGIGSRYFWVQN